MTNHHGYLLGWDHSWLSYETSCSRVLGHMSVVHCENNHINNLKPTLSRKNQVHLMLSLALYLSSSHCLTHSCARAHTHTHTHMHARTHTRMHTHARTHARTHTHTHTHTHTQPVIYCSVVTAPSICEGYYTYLGQQQVECEQTASSQMVVSG